MNDVMIRECTNADIEKVMELDRQWAAEDSTYGYVSESTEGFADRLGTYFLVAEVQDSVVGFAYGSVHVSEGMAVLSAGQTYFEVDAIYVANEHRNSGIGSMLLNELLEAARHNGIERSLIYSATKDLDKILRFYRIHGFKNWYIRMYR
jgi:ribosomal protein S18 acetylase RimI-like enzyme